MSTNGVQIEPTLEPRTGKVFSNATNSTENARVDIEARSVSIRVQRVYVNVKVFNPLARTHSLQKVYEKKRRGKEATLQRTYLTD